MRESQLFLSTIAGDAAQTARAYGLGLEIAEYCTASNLDGAFPQVDAALRKKLEGVPRRTFHAPFSELFPCAVDPQARDLARRRYRQAIAAAQSYGSAKVVIHGGFVPLLYFECWYEEQSILFWRDFMEEVPETVEICLENVLEPDPGLLFRIAEAVGHPRLRLCLDIGHANAYSAKASVQDWLTVCAPYLSHFHIHNNAGSWDSHNALNDGAIPMASLLEQAQALCPAATYAIEVQQSLSSVRWLMEQGILEVPL